MPRQDTCLETPSPFRDGDDDDDHHDAVVTSLLEIIPPKVELCPSDGPIVYTTSDMVAIVPKPAVRFRTGDGLQTLSHTCSHYGNASTNHSFALGTHRILCTARDHRYDNHAIAHCEFDIHIIGAFFLTVLWFCYLRNGGCHRRCLFVCLSVCLLATATLRKKLPNEFA